MAKNKWKGQKPRNVFHIASQKHFTGKSKAKPVTTNLKKVCIKHPGFLVYKPSMKIIIKNDEKIKRMNEAFVNIQKELAHFSQGLSLEPLQKQPALQPSQENRPVNVDEATRLMAQL